jgi:hypothetical protein
MTWPASPDGSPGLPEVLPDGAIRFCLSIKGKGCPEIRPVDGFQP